MVNIHNNYKGTKYTGLQLFIQLLRSHDLVVS